MPGSARAWNGGIILSSVNTYWPIMVSSFPVMMCMYIVYINDVYVYSGYAYSILQTC